MLPVYCKEYRENIDFNMCESCWRMRGKSIKSRHSDIHKHKDCKRKNLEWVVEKEKYEEWLKKHKEKKKEEKLRNK